TTNTRRHEDVTKRFGHRDTETPRNVQRRNAARLKRAERTRRAPRSGGTVASSRSTSRLTAAPARRPTRSDRARRPAMQAVPPNPSLARLRGSVTLWLDSLGRDGSVTRESLQPSRTEKSFNWGLP